MSRYSLIAALAGLIILGLPSTFAQNPPGPDTKKERVEGTQRYSQSHIQDRQWTVARTKEGNTETVTRVFKGASDAQPLLVEEEKITRINDQTTQVSRTSSNVDLQGQRKPVEVVQEERRKLQNGEERVTRTVSTPDLAGRFNVARRESETRTSPSQGQWNTTTTIQVPGIDGGFRQVQTIEQTEREKAPGVTEVSRVTSVPDANGNWAPLERRAILVEERKDSSKTEQEQTYRRDSSGQLSLSQRDMRSYRKDASGREYWTAETYGGKNTGFYPGEALQLERKVTSVRETLADGSQRTVQRVSDRNPADRSSGPQLVEETVTTSKPVGGGITEVVVEVKAADGNGNMKTLETRRIRIAER